MYPSLSFRLFVCRTQYYPQLTCQQLLISSMILYWSGCVGNAVGGYLRLVFEKNVRHRDRSFIISEEQLPVIFLQSRFWYIATSRLFQLAQFYSKLANYPGNKLVGVAYKLRKKMKNSPLCVHVLHRTLNVVISRCCFAEDGKEMYQIVKRTCRAIVFAHKAYCFVALSLPLPSSFLKIPNSLVTT